MSEPIRTTLTQRGEALTMEFSPVSRDWYVSDCKRYAICVTHGEQVAGFKPFGAFIRPLNDAPDKDGHRPAAVNIDFFQHLKGRDGAIAACIRHKRAHPDIAPTQAA
jgi:hypothetical protein